MTGKQRSDVVQKPEPGSIARPSVRKEAKRVYFAKVPTIQNVAAGILFNRFTQDCKREYRYFVSETAKKVGLTVHDYQSFLLSDLGIPELELLQTHTNELITHEAIARFFESREAGNASGSTVTNLARDLVKWCSWMRRQVADKRDGTLALQNITFAESLLTTRKKEYQKRKTQEGGQDIERLQKLNKWVIPEESVAIFKDAQQREEPSFWYVRKY